MVRQDQIHGCWGYTQVHSTGSTQVLGRCSHGKFSQTLGLGTQVETFLEEALEEHTEGEAFLHEALEERTQDETFLEHAEVESEVGALCWLQ